MSAMNKNELWQIFMKTGKVSDYLNYKNARDEQVLPVYEDEEFADEFVSDYHDNSDSDFPDVDMEDLNY